MEGFIMKTKLLFLLMVFYFFNDLTAQIIHVPDDYQTIQAGINAASSGDTVLVDTGTYIENINFNGKAIMVASKFIEERDSTYIHNTIINGSEPTNPDYGSTVVFESGEDTTSILIGFTITAGTGYYLNNWNARCGGGILCRNAGAKVLDNIIKNNEAVFEFDAMGGGFAAIIESSKAFHIVLKENEISGNVAEMTGASGKAWGGGIYILGVDANISSNVIKQNECISELSRAYGAGIAWEPYPNLENEISFTNNLVGENLLEGDFCSGCGIYANRSGAMISHNLIKDNNINCNLAYGCGLNIDYANKKIFILNNEITNNHINATQGGNGCGVFIFSPSTGSSIDISQNLISYNTFSGPGAAAGIGVAVAPESIIQINRNMICHNKAKNGAGIIVFNTYNLIITNNIFYGNCAEVQGGAMHFWPLSSNNNVILPHEDNIFQGLNKFRVEDYRPVVANNTFMKDSADYGGAIYVSYNENQPLFFNNLFWENGANLGKDICQMESGPELAIWHSNLDTNLIFANWSGDGNVNFDPQFHQGDSLCHLSDSSNCINKGIEFLEIAGVWYNCPDSDYEGESRPDTSCNIPDIGADEVMIDCTGINDLNFQFSTFNFQLYPNPTKGITDIKYQIPVITEVNMSVFNIRGKKIRTLINEKQRSGSYVVRFDGFELPVGIYLIRLQVGNHTTTTKLIRL